MEKDSLERFRSYAVNFKVEDRDLVDDPEDRDLVCEFKGDVVFLDDDKTIVVGKVRGQRVELGEAEERGSSLFDVFDAQSEELCGYYETLFDRHTGDLLDGFDLSVIGDLLVVHEISIVPKYQGLNLGLLTMLQTFRTFGGGCALVAIKPFPLQFTGKVNKKNERKFNMAQGKLRDYWSQLGFRRVRKTDYYYFPLERKLPSLEGICGKRK